MAVGPGVGVNVRVGRGVLVGRGVPDEDSELPVFEIPKRPATTKARANKLINVMHAPVLCLRFFLKSSSGGGCGLDGLRFWLLCRTLYAAMGTSRCLLRYLASTFSALCQCHCGAPLVVYRKIRVATTAIRIPASGSANKGAR